VSVQFRPDGEPIYPDLRADVEEEVCSRCDGTPVTCELFIDPRGHLQPEGTYYLCEACHRALKDWFAQGKADE